MPEIDWNKESECVLKAILKRKKVPLTELVVKLKQRGINETYASVVNKINRGTFSAAFLLQCLDAIDCKELSLK